MPLVVIEALVSIRIGSPSVGMPTASGSGVKTARVPPNGATLAVEGSELATVTMRPRSVARVRKVARQAMWWLLRTTTQPVPSRSARAAASSTARAVSQTPQMRRPSQVRQAPLSRTTSGSPSSRISPRSASSR